MKPSLIDKARAKLPEALSLPPVQQTAVARACLFTEGFPQDAYLWPVVEVVSTTVLRGGGESTSWHPHSTIRVNGKQVYREETAFRIGNPLEELFGNRLLKVKRDRNRDIYVLKPQKGGEK